MISFVVLHYKNIEDTIHCLECLKKICHNDSKFIVVDNNTLDSSSVLLIKKYTNDILILDKNYGFAQANNKGIEYARKKYNSDYYCILNNDVFIEQDDFIDNINKDYEKYQFDMLGTKINSPSGESVNPFCVLQTEKEVIDDIEKCSKLIKIYESSVLTFILDFYLKIKYIFKKRNIGSNGNSIMKNIALHGCCIIFSKKYIEKYEHAFYNETFLFHEEEFLYQRVLNDNLISIYDPNIQIFHKEGSSIKNSFKNIRKSKLFREKERLKSLNLLIQNMNKEYNYEEKR